MIVKRGRLDSLMGRMPVVINPADVTNAERRYHFFRERLVSTSGAQLNLNTWGSRLAATKAATASTDTPALEKR